LERQAKQLNDHYLPGAALLLRQLVQRGREDWSDEERQEIGAQLFCAIWTTVQRGRNYLDGKLAGEETQLEADAVLEGVLGKVWQLTELRERGYFRQNLHLLELAYEREDNEARKEKVETSYLLELNDGAIYRAVTYRPYRGMRHIPEQASYTQPLRISEAAIYPGFCNRRVRWEKSAEQTEPLTSAHLQTAYNLAAPTFEPVLAAFRKKAKNPLADHEPDVFLLRCAAIGWVGDDVVMEDAQGGRLVASAYQEFEDNVANLVRAAGMLRQPAVLTRLFLIPGPTRIVAQPLAALTPEVHLRLGE
jgi:hypothetical protein